MNDSLIGEIWHTSVAYILFYRYILGTLLYRYLKYFYSSFVVPNPLVKINNYLFFSEKLIKEHAFLLILLEQGFGHIAEEGRDMSFLYSCNICLFDLLTC